MAGFVEQYASLMTKICEGCGVPHVEQGFEETPDGDRCQTCVQLAMWADFKTGVLDQPRRRHVEGRPQGWVE